MAAQTPQPQTRPADSTGMAANSTQSKNLAETEDHAGNTDDVIQ
jgi:hypothetical protein